MFLEDAHSLEKIHLSIARAALPHCRKQDLLKSLDWPTLAWRRRQSKLAYFWLLMNGRGPPSLSKCVPDTVKERCSYNLRNARSVEFPHCSSTARLLTFIPSSIALWNSLPARITALSSLKSFSSSVELHFSADKYTFGLPP